MSDDIRIFQLTDNNVYVVTVINAIYTTYFKVEDVIQVSLSVNNYIKFNIDKDHHSMLFSNKQNIYKSNIIFEGYPTKELENKYKLYVANKKAKDEESKGEIND